MLTINADTMYRLLGDMADDEGAERFASYLQAQGWRLIYVDGYINAERNNELITEYEWQDALHECFANMEAHELDVNAIMESEAVTEFVTGVSTNAFGGGASHQLYLDLLTGKAFINIEASDSTWLSRDDGSLAMITRYICLDDDIIEAYDGWEAEYRLDLKEKITKAIRAFKAQHK